LAFSQQPLKLPKPQPQPQPQPLIVQPKRYVSHLQHIQVEGMIQGDHDYLMSTGIEGVLKVGRAEDVAARRMGNQATVSRVDENANVRVLIQWLHCGRIEKYLHRLLRRYCVLDVIEHSVECYAVTPEFAAEKCWEALEIFRDAEKTYPCGVLQCLETQLAIVS
jgi:hypothetical protein